MPSQAQRKRAEARESRRDDGSDESPHADGGSTEDQALDTVKQAAKVAAASLAAGAVAAAVRALADRRDSGQGSENDEPQNAEPEDEVQSSDNGEPQSEPPAGEAQPEESAEAQAEQQEPEQPEPEQAEAPQREQLRQRPETHVRQEPVQGATADEAKQVVDEAKRELELLVGRTPETVSSLERTDDGWLVAVEVVEVSRVPESTDVLASYEIELDGDRNLRRYARVRRYYRSQANREDM